MDIKKIYDISLMLGVENNDTPDNYKYEAKWHITKHPNGEEFHATDLRMKIHTGTHHDAPIHLVPRTKTNDEYGLDRFIIPAQTVTIENKEMITVEELRKHSFRNGEAVLFRTNNSISGLSTKREATVKDPYVYMHPDAAQYLYEQGITMFGFDFSLGDPRPGTELGEKLGSSIHRFCFDHDVIILEGINLKDVPDDEYMLFALPLKIKGCDGAPVRAILIKE